MDPSNDKILKDCLRAMDEYFEKNRKPCLRERFQTCIDTTDPELLVNELVNIVEEFLPTEHPTNSSGWNDCIKQIKQRLR
jgi:hypothetical protein